VCHRGSEPPASNAPWGIISVKGQLCDHELPMQPITMMRNALGAEEVGALLVCPSVCVYVCLSGTLSACLSR
jgi:hypothetical protein